MVCGLLQLIGIVAVMQTITPRARAGLRTWSAVPLAISPLGLLLAGIFTLQSALVLHIVAGMPVFATPVVSFVVAGAFLRGTPGWKPLGRLLPIAGPLSCCCSSSTPPVSTRLRPQPDWAWLVLPSAYFDAGGPRVVRGYGLAGPQALVSRAGCST